MKTKSFSILATCLVAATLSFADAANADELYSQISPDLQNNAEYVSYKNFLIGLGFKDYCQEMQKSLATPGITEVSKRVLTYNMQEYQIVNIAREIAAMAFSFDKSAPTLAPAKQKLLTGLATYLLLPFQDFTPAQVAGFGAQNHLDHDKSYSQLMRNKMANEKQTLLAGLVDFADIKDDQMVAKLDTYLNRYLQLKYVDTNLRQTNYLGRAMVASFVRMLRRQGRAADEAQLQAEMLVHGVYLKNYISSQLTFINNANQPQTVTVYAGDFANEYSKGSEAYYISIGTVPSSQKNRALAKSNNLLGNALEVIFYPSPDAESDLIQKVKDGKTLSAKEKIQYSMIQSKKNVAGYSHVGSVAVNEDPETGIQMAWIWDVYPTDGGLGGMRFVGPEGFAFAGEFQKIGFVHYDPVKFLNYYKHTISTRGYLPDVWVSKDASIDQDNHIIPGTKNEQYVWKTKISSAEALSYLNVNENDAGQWIKTQIAPKVAATLEGYFDGPEAIAFADGFHNVRGAAYCSEAVVLSYLQGADIDPEVESDKWSKAVRIGRSFKISYLEDMDFSGRIVSPSGFAWQKDLLAWHTAIMLQQTIDPKNNDNATELVQQQLDQSLQNLIGRVSLSGFQNVEPSDQDAE